MDTNKKPKPEEKFPGYTSYPASEDIFKKGIEESDIDPEDITKKKEPNSKPGEWNEKDFNEDQTGEDLDVPGAELEETNENPGNEDEENDYYSIGGDNHDNLEEHGD